MINYLAHLFHLVSKDRIKRFLKFCSVGLSGIGVSFCVFWFSTRVAGINDLIALILGTEASILSNFALNDIWTFRDKRVGSTLTRIKRFHIVCLGVIVIYYAVYTPFTRLLEIYDLLAWLIAIMIGVIWNFTLNLIWTWRKK